MKKVLIIATAFVFAASSIVMATTQKETGKSQPQKTVAPVKQEAKTVVKAEVKPAATEVKAVVSNEAKATAQPVHKKHKVGKAKSGEIRKAEKHEALPVQKTAEPAKEIKQAAPIRK